MRYPLILLANSSFSDRISFLLVLNILSSLASIFIHPKGQYFVLILDFMDELISELFHFLKFNDLVRRFCHISYFNKKILKVKNSFLGPKDGNSTELCLGNDDLL